MSSGLESIKKSSTLESSTLAISTLNQEGEGRDHTCAVSDVPSRVELSSFIDSSPEFLTSRDVQNIGDCTEILSSVV